VRCGMTNLPKEVQELVLRLVKADLAHALTETYGKVWGVAACSVKVEDLPKDRREEFLKLKNEYTLESFDEVTNFMVTSVENVVKRLNADIKRMKVDA
jgi:hypothetical protein